tara:strand:- start:1101 stop:1385 length:285 start_codon:yes stop_codon:yes gene_type:complete
MLTDKGGFKVGDLVRVVDTRDSETYIFRPYGFPCNKVGLVTDLQFNLNESLEIADIDLSSSSYDYEFQAFCNNLIGVLVEGRKYWIFLDELKKL